MILSGGGAARLSWFVGICPTGHIISGEEEDSCTGPRAYGRRDEQRGTGAPGRNSQQWDRDESARESGIFRRWTPHLSTSGDQTRW